MSQETDQEDHSAGEAREVDRPSRGYRRSLIAFEVGVGKTYTALAIIARARQQGWVRRPVAQEPSSKTTERR